MNVDFEIKEIDRAMVEREARRLRAEAFAKGVRSVRNWTMAAFQRRPAVRSA